MAVLYMLRIINDAEHVCAIRMYALLECLLYVIFHCDVLIGGFLGRTLLPQK